MNVNELFSKVANYLKPVAIAFFILEAVLLLLVGGFLGAILEDLLNAPLETSHTFRAIASNAASN